LQAAFQILARFHLLAVTKGVPRVTHNLAPALITRSSVLRKIAQHADQIESHLLLGLGDELDVRAIDLLRLIRTRGAAIAPNVAAAAERNWFQQPAIRDIWHDHLLFTGNELTGIVDFGAMNVDTPLTDVARLVGSLVRDDREARRVALDAYSKVRPLTGEDRELIDLLDRSGVLVAAVNWLKWLYIDRRDMGPTPPIIRRLDEILQRLKNQS
jgi:homoserine kinase type II